MVKSPLNALCSKKIKTLKRLSTNSTVSMIAIESKGIENMPIVLMAIREQTLRSDLNNTEDTDHNKKNNNNR